MQAGKKERPTKSFEQLLRDYNIYDHYWAAVHYEKLFFSREQISYLTNKNTRDEVFAKFHDRALGDAYSETIWKMLSTALRETKQPYTQLIPSLQAYMLHIAATNLAVEFHVKNIVRIFVATINLKSFRYVQDDFYDFAGIEKHASFKPIEIPFEDLLEKNTISIQDMMRDNNLLDNAAGYAKVMEIPNELQDLAYLSMCISGEAGEIANSCKKLIRDGHSDEEWLNLQKEIVDVLIYIAKLANNAGLDIDELWKLKVHELYERNGLQAPEKLSYERRGEK